MSLSNDLRREMDDAGDLMTGEDVLTHLVTNVGWDIAKTFATFHNELVSGSGAPTGYPFTQGVATGSPLYEIEKLVAWLKSV